MKNRLLFALLHLSFVFLLPGKALAQADDKLPQSSLTLSDGRYFSTAEIPKNKPVLLIYFDPECDHCHTLMNAFFKRTTDFAGAEVLMVTSKPINDVRAFVQAHQTHRYSNIRVGTEGTTYFLRNYYKMQNTPFVVLYNKEGKRIAAYQKDVPLDAVHAHLKKANTTNIK